ncbi:MAG: oxygen-dependent coproporphyrinogen oxidase [Flavobacteriales bacterium]
MPNKEHISEQYRALQLHICQALEAIDTYAKFSEDTWQREEGGGGHTRTLTGGHIFEKAGVAFSAVHGPVTAAMKKQLGHEGERFFATGVSIVLHPVHPRHPIMHMNVRYFELEDHSYWFGGGIDLTPHFVDFAKAQAFHQSLKSVSDQYNKDFYPQFKEWADRYFFLPHRNESRGVGGIFFDQLDEKSGLTKDQIFQYCLDLGRLFPVVYAQQLDGLALQKPTKAELDWQALRRGRYVEFNLLHDRGTKFGIYSGGRTESILMSMPPMANWVYNQEPAEGTEEQKTLSFLRAFHEFC